MRSRAAWITIGVLAITFMLAVDVYAQPAQKVYGYVRVDGNLTNNVTVTLYGPGVQLAAVTANGGYYEITNGSLARKDLSVSASYNNRSGSYHFIMPTVGDWQADLSLTVPPTPTPTPTPVPTPTPRPSGEPGGTVIRNDSSYFIPAPVLYPPATPVPKPPRPTNSTPSTMPTSTPVPPAGILSGAYAWLAIALIAILAIAIALLAYLKR